MMTMMMIITIQIVIKTKIQIIMILTLLILITTIHALACPMKKPAPASNTRFEEGTSTEEKVTCKGRG